MEEQPNSRWCEPRAIPPPKAQEAQPSSPEQEPELPSLPTMMGEEQPSSATGRGEPPRAIPPPSAPEQQQQQPQELPTQQQPPQQPEQPRSSPNPAAAVASSSSSTAPSAPPGVKGAAASGKPAKHNSQEAMSLWNNRKVELHAFSKDVCALGMCLPPPPATEDHGRRSLVRLVRSQPWLAMLSLA